MYSLILASQSPRRRQILSDAGYKIEVVPIKISEILKENMNLDAALQDLARQKACAALDQHKWLKSPKYLVVTGDTVVVLDDEVLGKPKDLHQAREYLQNLSGRSHSVKTAVGLWTEEKWMAFVEETKVWFRLLDGQVIEKYIQAANVLDKAGAYGIQDAACNFVDRIEGSFFNVVGFPLERFEQELRKYGWKC